MGEEFQLLCQMERNLDRCAVMWSR